jgi:hypothetical protein
VGIHNPRHRQRVVQLGLDTDAKDFFQDKNIKSADIVTNQDRLLLKKVTHVFVGTGRVEDLTVTCPRQNVDFSSLVKEPISLHVKHDH